MSPTEWMGEARGDTGYAFWLSDLDVACRRQLGVTIQDHHLSPDMIDAREFFERQIPVDETVGYIKWYLDIDQLCVRFLSGCHLWAFDPHEYSATDYWEEGWRPESFFADVVLTNLQPEYPDLYRLVADAAIWGAPRRGRGAY